MQQLREAFPFEASHKYLIFDCDQKFGSFPSELHSEVHGRMASRSGGWEAVDETCWTTLLR
jgi:hypothetical protein